MPTLVRVTMVRNPPPGLRNSLERQKVASGDEKTRKHSENQHKKSQRHGKYYIIFMRWVTLSNVENIQIVED